MEHLRSRRAVNILIAFERCNQAFISGDMRQYAQLNLRIIGIQKAEFRTFGNENFPKLSPQLQTDRNILQIRLC